MRRNARFAAVHAACIGVMMFAGSVSAQSADRQSTVGEVSLPGGLAPALAAIGDVVPPDRGQFLLEFIRRTYDTPFGPKGDPREIVLQSLLAGLKAGERAAGPSETLPLPLDLKTWTDIVFAGRSTPETLVSSILQSRAAALFYCALLSLDDDTRAWLAGQPDLIAQLASRHSTAFLAAAPGVRIAPTGLRMPGGAAADSAWHALVGQRPTEPARFIKALMESDEGRLARFVGAISQLTPAQIAAVLNLESPDDGRRVDAARRLYSVFQRMPAWRMSEQHAFTRPPLDPVLLAAELGGDAGGPRVPGTRGFWDAVFSDEGDAPANPAAVARAKESGEAADFAWLCEQVFKTESNQHRRYTMVLFAARHAGGLNPVTADAIDAVRSAGGYPALTAALERARVTDLAAFAAAVRRADTIAAIKDDSRASRALAQFQGAIAIIARAASRGSVNGARVSEFVASLSAIPLSERGEYEGRMVCWLDGWLRAQAGGQESQPAPAIGSAEEVFAGAAGPLEQAALRLLAGPAPSQPRLIEWEGTRYRVDFRRAEAVRIAKALGGAPRPYLSSAEAIVSRADALAEPGVTRERLRQLAQEIASAAQNDGADNAETASDAPVTRDRSALTSLERAAHSGNVAAAARLAPSLRLLADEMLARGLIEFAYAAALGPRDGLSIAAAEAASRHDFGLKPGPVRPSAWQLPSPGYDSLQRWRVAGSLLGLDVGLAEFSLVRLSFKPPPRPTVGEADRRTFIEEVALIEPAPLTDPDRDVIVGAIQRGRTTLQSVRTTAAAYAIADRARLSPARRSVLPWIVMHDRERVAAFLSPLELFWIGLEGTRPAALDAWGATAKARRGCLCLQVIDPGPWEFYAGRWYSGMAASAFPDLNLRLAELLAELHMPAALLAPILTSATLDFVNSAVTRDPDDRRGLVEFVQALRAERVELYLALLTTDGPLVPIGEAAGPKDKEDLGFARSIPRVFR